ncbi:MAG: hypothetical protein C0403_08220 [Desulfobacterium sp.]|nr:hypothetical protein [Desulfobacterium sp.]
MMELISKLLKSITPAKIGAQKRAENTGDQLSPERQQQTFEIGSMVYISVYFGRVERGNTV